MADPVWGTREEEELRMLTPGFLAQITDITTEDRSGQGHAGFGVEVMHSAIHMMSLRT